MSYMKKRVTDDDKKSYEQLKCKLFPRVTGTSPDFLFSDFDSDDEIYADEASEDNDHKLSVRLNLLKIQGTSRKNWFGELRKSIRKLDSKVSSSENSSNGTLLKESIEKMWVFYFYLNRKLKEVEIQSQRMNHCWHHKVRRENLRDWIAKRTDSSKEKEKEKRKPECSQHRVKIDSTY